MASENINFMLSYQYYFRNTAALIRQWYRLFDFYSNFAHQKINCAQTVSDVARFSIRFLSSEKNAPGRLWSGNCRRSVGLPGSLCFAMFRWIRVWTIEPPGGSGILAGTLPLRRTTQWCIMPQNTWRKHQRVRKCPLKYLNPPLRRVREDTFIEHRNSKAIRLPASR